MKKLYSLAVLLLIAATGVFAQDKPHKHKSNAERASPHDTVRTKDITISYGRPYKKGRVIFGTQEEHDNNKALEVYGKVWRVGADEATQITIKKDCTFGDQHLTAGVYTLFAIPGEKEWTIILNSQLDQWGAFSYDKYKDKDVIHTKVPVKATKSPVEQFTITLSRAGMLMEWDHSSVMVPIRFASPLPTY